MFWELPPLINRAPYAFHWSYDSIKIWIPNESDIIIHTLKLSECEDLLQQLDFLLGSIGESAVKIMADKNRNRESIFLGHPAGYRIKYYPPDYLSTIMLSSIEFDGLPWVENVKSVKEMFNNCIKT